MNKFNLVLSGGGVRSYTHLGVYKYLYEQGFEFNEIVAVSGGSFTAPFALLKKDPDKLIELFKKEKIHKKLFPFWFIPDKFEFLVVEPKTLPLGEWIEEQLTKDELDTIYKSKNLHIMGTRYPQKGLRATGVDMLEVTDLKNSVAASTAISGVFKAHKIDNHKYIDGGHWNNIPIFYDFKDKNLPLIASNLGYTGLLEKEGGRISKIIRGFEISSYAKLQEDINNWAFAKECGKRNELIVINSSVWNISSLDFNLSDWQINEMIEAGYKAAKKTFALRSESIIA